MDWRRIKLIRRVTAIIFLAALSLLVFADSLVGSVEKEPEKNLSWPEPPETPRIKFVKSVSSPKDLKLERSSFLKRAMKKIIGIESADSTMLFPYGIVVDSRHRLIVADQKLRLIHVFDAQAGKYFSIKQPKGEVFVSLVGLALDGEDNIYVSDSYTGKIFVFDRTGKFKKRLGPDEGIFNRPTGIAIDQSLGRLYVVETVKGEVAVLDLNGTELFKIGKRGYGNGEFNFPTQICLRGDRIYITDTLNARVQILDKDGKFISAIGRLGDAIGDLDKPKGVAVDSEGHVYVVEGLRDRVEIFDQDGKLLLTFGSTGSGRGEFYLPTAIHIDADDNVYVSDSYNRRVQIFKYLKNDGSTGD